MIIKNIKKNLSIILTIIILLQPSLLVKANEINEVDRLDEMSTEELISQIDALNELKQSGNINEDYQLDNEDQLNGITDISSKIGYDYSAGFKLGTQLKTNTTKKDFMRFKVNVNKNGNVTFGLDGQASERGYVWSDKFTIQITDISGKEKYSVILTDWSSAYSGALDLVNKLNGVNVSVFDTITITSRYWRDTVFFYELDNNKLYQPTANKNLVFDNDTKRVSYFISQYGLIKQTKENTIGVNHSYSIDITLKVKEISSGKILDKIITLGTTTRENGVDKYTYLTIHPAKFGKQEGFVWADDYVFFTEYNNGTIGTGAYLRKNTHVGDGLVGLVSAFTNWEIKQSNKLEVRLSMKSDNNSIKLMDQNTSSPSLYTNTKTNFSTGLNKSTIKFYETAIGLMQV